WPCDVPLSRLDQGQPCEHRSPYADQAPRISAVLRVMRLQQVLSDDRELAVPSQPLREANVRRVVRRNFDIASRQRAYIPPGQVECESMRDREEALEDDLVLRRVAFELADRRRVVAGGVPLRVQMQVGV